MGNRASSRAIELGGLACFDVGLLTTISPIWENGDSGGRANFGRIAHPTKLIL